MSEHNANAQSPLTGARFKGLVMVQEEPPQGMITLRCDLSGAAGAVEGVIGAALPAARQVTISDNGSALWMSPDELLLLCPYPEVSDTLSMLSGAMEGSHHLAADVSDARAVFTLSGEARQIREVLAKLTPADLREASLPVAELRRTRLAQVPAAFWFESETAVRLICFRSVAQYVFDLLKAAANPMAEVDYG